MLTSLSHSPSSPTSGGSSPTPVSPLVPVPPGAPGSTMSTTTPSASVSALASTTGELAAARNPAISRPWEHLWFTLLSRGEWSSLAIVPASPDIDTLVVARSLAWVGHAYLDQPVLVIDATRVMPAEVASRLRANNERVAAGARVLMALGSPTERAACIPMVRGVDAAVLVVRPGTTGLTEARQVIDVVGSNRFLGAITLTA